MVCFSIPSTQTCLSTFHLCSLSQWYHHPPNFQRQQPGCHSSLVSSSLSPLPQHFQFCLQNIFCICLLCLHYYCLRPTLLPGPPQHRITGLLPLLLPQQSALPCSDATHCFPVSAWWRMAPASASASFGSQPLLSSLPLRHPDLFWSYP